MFLTRLGLFKRIGRRDDQSPGGHGIWGFLRRSLLWPQNGSMAAGVERPAGKGGFVLGPPPIAETQAPRSQSPVVSSVSDSTKPTCRRILVVDDNVDAARSLAKVLTLLHGQNVQVAHDGPTALELAESFRPQVVLLDIGLPGMNGYEVALELRRRPWFEGCMLVAVTGWVQENDQATSHDTGFDHYLVKPVDQATIQGLLVGDPRPDQST